MSPGLKSTNLYGPVPTGLMLVGCIARLGADERLEHVLGQDHAVGAPRTRSAQNGVGLLNVTRTVCESIFSTLTSL